MSVNSSATIRQFVENFEATNIQLVVMGTPIRSGSFLLQSLVDNHPAILHLPKQHFFYFDWHYSLHRYGERTHSLIDAYWEESYHLRGYIHKMGINADQTLDLRYPEIRQAMVELAEVLTLPLNRKRCLLLFYAAYAQVHDIDLTQINVIFHHNHFLPNRYGYQTYRFLRDHTLADNDLARLCQLPRLISGKGVDPILDALLTDFPTVKCIVTLRHPMAGLYSYLKDWQKSTVFEVVHHDDLTSFYNRSYFCLLNYLSCVGLRHRLGDALSMATFEDMHANPKQLMATLANFIGIKYAPVLLESTFMGVPWVARVGQHQQQQQGTSPDRLANETQWQTQWDTPTQALFGTLAKPIAQVFGYEMNPSFENSDACNAPWPDMETSVHKGYGHHLVTEMTHYAQQFNEQFAHHNGYPRDAANLLAHHGEHLPLRHSFYQRYPDIRQTTIQAISEAGKIIQGYSGSPKNNEGIDR